MSAPGTEWAVGGRRAAVTGAGAGIGRAVAMRLARDDMRVAVIDVDLAAAEHVAADIRQAGHEAMALGASVTCPESVETAMAQMDDCWGGIDVLVNNAGVTGNCPTLDLTDEIWRSVVDINIGGVFRCSQAAGRRMVKAKSGIIINIGSIYSIVAAPNRLAYCATKAAVAMMTKSLALEWAGHGVRVNCVAPGYVDTPGTQELVTSGRLDLAPIKQRTPLNRLAEPAEIADVVAFLASDAAAFITGQVLAVDGGWTANGYV